MVRDIWEYETTQVTGRSTLQGKVTQVFESLDRNKSGSLDLDEVEAGMKALGIPVSKPTVQRVFHRLDSDGDGKVTLQEFGLYCESRLVEIRQTFDAIDTDHSGTISSEEIKLCVQVGSATLAIYMPPTPKSAAFCTQAALRRCGPSVI